MPRVWVMVRTCAVAGVVLLLGVRRATAQETDSLPPGVTDSMVARGAELFRGSARCVACHGADGRGTEHGPDLTDDKWLDGHGDYEAIARQVRHGAPRRGSRTGRAMPMRGMVALSDDDVRAVAAYVWRLSHAARGNPPN
jgi:mono/diheme cytochrome c family protein